MDEQRTVEILDKLRNRYPEKFLPEEEIFSRIHRGDRIFISTACGEPQYLVHALIEFVESHPKAFFDAEVLHARSRMAAVNSLYDSLIALAEVERLLGSETGAADEQRG